MQKCCDLLQVAGISHGPCMDHACCVFLHEDIVTVDAIILHSNMHDVLHQQYTQCVMISDAPSALHLIVQCVMISIALKITIAKTKSESS